MLNYYQVFFFKTATGLSHYMCYVLRWHYNISHPMLRVCKQLKIRREKSSKWWTTKTVMEDVAWVWGTHSLPNTELWCWLSNLTTAALVMPILPELKQAFRGTGTTRLTSKQVPSINWGRYPQTLHLSWFSSHIFSLRLRVSYSKIWRYPSTQKHEGRERRFSLAIMWHHFLPKKVRLKINAQLIQQ